MRLNKGQVANAAMIGVALLSAVVTTAGNWIVNHVLDAPDTQAAAVGTVTNRVTVLETKQAATDTTTKNQGNKIDYLVTAIQKIGNKVGADIPPPPINQ